MARLKTAPFLFSAGQKRLIALAAVLALRPEALILMNRPPVSTCPAAAPH